MTETSVSVLATSVMSWLMSAMDFKDGATQKREYTWDSNGNMTSDANKRIFEITYNELNLPHMVRFNDGHATEYVYAADGRKLAARYLLSGMGFITRGDAEQDDSELRGGIFPDDPPPGGTVTDDPVILTERDYVGDHVYVNGSLERVVNPYGYWADTCYFYHVRDYQGNVRAVVDGEGVLREVNGYYPYGGLTGGGAAGVQPMKYGAKELDRECGTDLYDSLARWYDSFACQTTTQDQCAEKYYSLSPYLWCGGNPVRNTDPTGMVLTVSNEYQDYFLDTFDKIFGQIGFYFENSTLQFNGATDELNEEQLLLFYGVINIMESPTITDVLYDDVILLNTENGNLLYYPKFNGGEGTFLVKDNLDLLNNNFIIIDKAIDKLTIPLLLTDKDGNSLPIDRTYRTSKDDLLFHAFGHVLNSGEKQSNVIDFHNLARKILKLKPLPYYYEHYEASY